MKKVLVLLLFVSSTQLLFAQARFGLRAGLNIANQKITVKYLGESASQSGDAIVSFHVGGTADFSLSESISIQPSLILSGKGMNLDSQDDITGETYTSKLRPFYLELPVNIVYKYPLPSTNVTIYGGGGPSLAYGLFGKAKANGESDDVFQSDGFKRFDFGINITAGVELPSGLQMSFNFTPGLTNIYDGAPDPDFDILWKNKVFGFSVAYFLNGASASRN